MNTPEAQLARLRSLDGRLAGASMRHMSGEPILTRGKGDEAAAVGWTVDRIADDDPRRAFMPAVVAPAVPLVLPASDSATAARNVGLVLEDWRRAVAEAAPEAVLQVTWPSADPTAPRWLTEAGFVPRGVFACRPPGPPRPVRPEVERTAKVRQARPDELDAAVALHEEEAAFNAALGFADGHGANAAAAARARFAAGLAGTGRSLVHLVDLAGTAVAMCESWPVEVTASGATGGHSAGRFLPPGRYAYLNTVGVTADHRGRGLGGLLVAGVLRDLRDLAPEGTFLWYESANPVSPGFWQAMGYRPLWTRYQRTVSD